VSSHEPIDYRCPFCRNLRDGTSDFPLEIIHRDADVFVKMNPKWWPRNPGGVLVIPVQHFESIYTLPPSLGTPIQRSVRDVALAMKSAFGCDGVSTRQHNEPAGNQDVWHYHVHVFPRWHGDDLYQLASEPAEPGRLREYAELLRGAWTSESPARLVSG
jgi:histidine triad (HIT) family protein